jgi:MFS family permease
MRHELGILFTHRDILLTSLMEAAQYFSFGAVETFLPLYLKSLGWEARVIGPLFTIQVITIALTKPLTGKFSDRLGRKQFILAGLLIGAAATALMPWISNWLLMALLMSLFGLCVAAVTAATSAFVSDLSRAAAYGASLGMLSSVMDIGHSTGPMVTGLLVAALSYRAAFGIVAAILGVLCALFFVLVRAPSRA